MNPYHQSSRSVSYQQSAAVSRSDQQMNDLMAVNHNSHTPSNFYNQYYEDSPRYHSNRPGTVSSIPPRSIFVSDEEYIPQSYQAVNVSSRGQQYKMNSQHHSSSNANLTSPHNRDAYYMSTMNRPIPMHEDDSYAYSPYHMTPSNYTYHNGSQSARASDRPNSWLFEDDATYRRAPSYSHLPVSPSHRQPAYSPANHQDYMGRSALYSDPEGDSEWSRLPSRPRNASYYIPSMKGSDPHARQPYSYRGSVDEEEEIASHMDFQHFIPDTEDIPLMTTTIFPEGSFSTKAGADRSYTINTHFDKMKLEELTLPTPYSVDGHQLFPASPSPQHFWSRENTPRSHHTHVVDASNRSHRSAHTKRLPSPTGSDATYEHDVSRLPIWKKEPFQVLVNRVLTRSNLNHTAGKMDAAMIRKKVEGAVELKHVCKLLQARSVFIELVFENPLEIQVWLEFCRFEMECGEFRNARCVVESALLLHPHNVVLLQRYIRVDERLGDVSNILKTLKELKSIDTQKAMKALMDGLKVLARMGNEKDAYDLYMAVLKNSRYFAGNFYLEYLLFEENSATSDFRIQRTMVALNQFPKYGPLWFYCFDLLEHHALLQWQANDFCGPVMTENYKNVMNQALINLTDDIRWRTFFYRIQFLWRCIVCLQRTALRKPHLLSHLTSVTVQSLRQIVQDMEQCLVFCPTNLKWRLFVMVGRFAVLTGDRSTCHHMMKRALSYAPSKNFYQVYLDFTKTSFFAGDAREAQAILLRAIQNYPEEWKLELELVHQAIHQDLVLQALTFNQFVIRNHPAAGRVWSTYIQLMHCFFGPEAAMKVFRKALRSVAKSGEVWCEGARIFMNPCSRLFDPQNAGRCLNFAIFFTPQYSDSYIEAIRLLLLTSDRFLMFYQCSDPRLLAFLLTSEDAVQMFIKKACYEGPNYGSLWFRCKEFSESTAMEVLYRCIDIVAREIALNAQLYYDALLMCARRKNSKLTPFRRILRSRFSAAIAPESLCQPKHCNVFDRRVQILYGASQMDC